MTAEGNVRPAQETILRWLDGSDQRIRALLSRVEAGEDVREAEARETALNVLTDLARALDPDRVYALVDRIAAGEVVSDPEAREMFLDVFANVAPSR